MRVHVRESTGLVLDFGVATARKMVFDVDESDGYGFEIVRLLHCGDTIERTPFNPSRNRADGLWIVNELLFNYHVRIENKKSDVIMRCSRESKFEQPLHYVTYKGCDLVEAASRCYVSLRRGTYIDIPEHYVNHQIERDVTREILFQQIADSRRK